VSDEFTVPVCRVHHRELHRTDDEAAWWRRLNIDPLPVALKLWQQTRSDSEPVPITQTQPAKTPEVLRDHQARTSHDACTDPESAPSKNTDGSGMNVVDMRDRLEAGQADVLDGDDGLAGEIRIDHWLQRRGIAA
jgi:hypothetical protein